jgi:hypothetical protein
MTRRNWFKSAAGFSLATVILRGQQQPFALADGTPVRLRLNRNLSSAEAKAGETVDFEVLEDLLAGDIVVARRGGTALATVTEAHPRGRMGKAGKLNVSIDHLRLVDGQKVALRAVKEAAGSGKAGTMTGAIVATSIVFFPAAPLFLFMRGKDITIPKGTEITAYVHGEVRLEQARFTAPAPAMPPDVTVVMTAAAPSAGPGSRYLRNYDIITLKQAGFTESLVITKIKSTPGAYTLETSDMITLKKNGLSDAVIEAMMENNAK